MSVSSILTPKTKPVTREYEEGHARTFGQQEKLTHARFLAEARPDETISEWRARVQDKD